MLVIETEAHNIHIGLTIKFFQAWLIYSSRLPSSTSIDVNFSSVTKGLDVVTNWLLTPECLARAATPEGATFTSLLTQSLAPIVVCVFVAATAVVLKITIVNERVSGIDLALRLACKVIRTFVV